VTSDAGDRQEATARLEGDLDLASVDEAVATIVGTDGATVVVDLAGVTFLDSAGLRGLLMARERLEAEGRSMRLVNPVDRVRRVLDVTNTGPVLGLES
jgi:anti-anti-sigma factor